MRFALSAALSLMLPFAALPAWADPAGEDAACINETARHLGVASVSIKVLDRSPTGDGALVTLDLSGRIATCNVTAAYEVLEVTTGDSRIGTAAERWQDVCVNATSAMLGIAPSEIAIGENIGGQVDILVLGGQPMVCYVAPDGSVLGVDFR